MEKELMLSVSMITYKHETYIAQAIEGVLMQKTDFDFDLVICDDFSPDSTEQIIRDIISTHPKGHLIKYFRHPKNIGMQSNGLYAVKQCHGKYIALCEGDDYWTDPQKLQKQVDFLEANEEFVLTFHPVKILNPDGSLVEDFITNLPENYETQETLARFGNYIHTPSVVFRNIIKTFPPEFSLSPIGDYFLYMMLTNHGMMKMLEGEMAVYRYGVGVFSLQSKIEKAKASFKLYGLILSYSDNFQVNKILLEKLLGGINYFEDLIEAKYTGVFVSDHPFFTLMSALKTPITLWKKIKSRF